MFPTPAQQHHALVHYDAVKKRLWIHGQRCHHGATGALMAVAAGTGLLAAKLKPTGMIGLLATGTVLMAHDWHDRQIWFEKGWGTQP